MCKNASVRYGCVTGRRCERIGVGLVCEARKQMESDGLSK